MTIIMVLAWVVGGVAAWFAAAAVIRLVGAGPGCDNGLGYGIVIVAFTATLEYVLAFRGGFTPPAWILPVQVLVSIVLLIVAALLPYPPMDAERQQLEDLTY